jgi:hypothetical protein
VCSSPRGSTSCSPTTTSWPACSRMRFPMPTCGMLRQ